MSTESVENFEIQNTEYSENLHLKQVRILKMSNSKLLNLSNYLFKNMRTAFINLL